VKLLIYLSTIAEYPCYSIDHALSNVTHNTFTELIVEPGSYTVDGINLYTPNITITGSSREDTKLLLQGTMSFFAPYGEYAVGTLQNLTIMNGTVGSIYSTMNLIVNNCRFANEAASGIELVMNY
jgi:hypothetical protein